jgi:hypothetical protein
MDRSWNDYPVHLKYLLSDLETSTSPVKVLSKYISTLPEDPVLTEIFKSLGYSDQTDCFTREPSHLESIQALRSYLESEDPFFPVPSEWDVTRGIKEEYLKTYYESKIQDLSDAFDLGLTAFDSEDSLNALWTTPVKAVTESISTEESTPRHCRGLKFLTSKVKSIIYSKGFFSYKEVADELVKELEITEGLEKVKEEKNILRRVYDALNVLIASEVVVKKGKKYVWQCSTPDQNSAKRHQITITKAKIDEKKKVLQDLVTRFESVSQLLLRNKKKASCELIRFPFIIICTEDHPENTVKMESNPSHTEIVMKFKKEIQMFGDVEVLQKLELQEAFESVPGEIQSLLKK